MGRVRFVAVGELMLDVLVEGEGHDAKVRVRPGGSAANAAVWAAECGAEATVRSALGRDFAGPAIRAELERRGVEVLATTVDRTGTFVLAGGRRYAEPSPPWAADVDAASVRLPAADAILVSGYLAPAVILQVLEPARAPWVALDAARLGELPPAPCLFLNEERARALTGLEAEPAARRLADGRRLVCVTRGDRGAVGVLDGTLEQALGPGVDGGEALGAGDAFAAATLVALAEGAGLAHALAEGCRCGRLAAASADGWPVRK